MTNTLQHFINHIYLIIDASDSMRQHTSTVERVFDQLIEDLRNQSKKHDQETRVSIYLFGGSHNIRCLIFDQDVMRTKSLKGSYRTDGNTALVAATIKALGDARKMLELYGDHASVFYVITDGGENDSGRAVREELPRIIADLPDNYTIVSMVPDDRGIRAMQLLGFPSDNVSTWDIHSAAGVEKTGQVFAQSMDAFMVNRAAGVRRSTSFFQTDLTGKTSAIGKKDVPEISPRNFVLGKNNSTRTAEIRDFVQELTRNPYRAGSAFYSLIKPEKISPVKQIIYRNQKSGKFYGGPGSRALLGLPQHEIKVSPGNHAGFDIFVESTSYNRHIIPGMEVLVLKPGVTV